MQNMSDTSYSISSGIGFFGLLAIVFITLKLTNVIAWSWWWVTSPLWLPAAIVLGGFALIFIVAFIAKKAGH
jgi:hypothetical protein